MGFYTKYHSNRTSYNGVMYASLAEAKYAEELDWRITAGEIKSWGAQIKFPMVVNEKLVCTYVCDFKITHNDGSVEYVEVKGFETAAWKIKEKLFAALYPELRLTIIQNGYEKTKDQYQKRTISVYHRGNNSRSSSASAGAAGATRAAT